MNRIAFIVTWIVLSFTPVLSAQAIRFELGQRLRLFERELERPGMADRRGQALEPLEKATPTFFSGKLGDAAGLLDRARLLLGKEKPTERALWAESLVVRPAARLLDIGAKALPLEIATLYRTKADRPEQVLVRLTLTPADGKRAILTQVKITELPVKVDMPLRKLPEGDLTLRCEVMVDKKVQATSEQVISLVDQLEERLAKLRTAVEANKAKPATLESATLARLVGILEPLRQRETLETNYPAHRLMTEAEAVLAAFQAGKTYYGPARAGQFWLTLPTGDAVRVQIPAEAAKGKPLPVVVAMHGAGGSENMFFDGYGDGKVAKLCAERGWLLVTTRTPLLSFGGGPDVPRIVDALARVYPLDTKKVFLVGHSMGAAQAVAAAGRRPERFLAVAALGGGGGFRDSEGVKGVRFFVGVGDRDFALGGARKLHQALVKAGVKTARLKVYDKVEHLIVVQLALAEVFAFFDEALGS